MCLASQKAGTGVSYSFEGCQRAVFMGVLWRSVGGRYGTGLWHGCEGWECVYAAISILYVTCGVSVGCGGWVCLGVRICVHLMVCGCVSMVFWCVFMVSRGVPELC